jgi:polysaccharide export outer membrane protein
VQNKKILYLQDPEKKKNGYPTDSVIREYPLAYKPYQLRPGDIISLRVGTLTPKEFNFVREYEEQLGEIRKLNQYVQQPQYRSNQGGQRGGNVLGNLNLGNIGRMGGGGGLDEAIILGRLQTGFVIDEKGELGLPEIGFIRLEGLTIPQAEELIEERLTGYFETPIVRIQMLNFHFTIMGEVNNEGRFTSFETENTIFDAIMMAGNLTEFADRKKIKIIRTVDNTSQVIYIDPLDEDMLMAKNYYLQPDDMIVVPPLKARFWRRYVIPDASTALGILTAAISLFLLVETLRR